MTCTNNPIRGTGFNRASLFDRLGWGNIWDWLRDLLAGVFFRSDLYDDQSHPYLGIGRDYIAAPDVVGNDGTSEQVVNDIANAEPDTYAPQDDPGISLYFSSYPEWRYSISTGWTIHETHQEIIVKSLINGVVRYGRIPLWATYPPEGSVIGTTVDHLFPDPPTWNVGSPQTTINAIWSELSLIANSVSAVKDLMEQQGVIRGYVIPPPS